MKNESPTVSRQIGFPISNHDKSSTIPSPFQSHSILLAPASSHLNFSQKFRSKPICMKNACRSAIISAAVRNESGGREWVKQINDRTGQNLQSAPQFVYPPQSSRFNSQNMKSEPTQKNPSIFPKSANHCSAYYENNLGNNRHQEDYSRTDRINPVAKHAKTVMPGLSRELLSAGIPTCSEVKNINADNCPRNKQASDPSDGLPISGHELVPDVAENNRRTSKIKKPARKSGHPIEISIREKLESKLGFNMGDVRVHHQGEMAEHVRKANAEAITHENHIYFASGKYNPHLRIGRALLVHELTHVLQHKSLGKRGNQLTPRQLLMFEHQARKNEQATYQNHDHLPVTHKSPALNVSPGSQAVYADACVHHRVVDSSSYSANITRIKNAPIQAAKTDRTLPEVTSDDSEQADTGANHLEANDTGHAWREETYRMLTFKLQLEKERMGS